MNTENLWRRLFQFTLVISGGLASIGLLQVAGSAGLVTRIDATFGNPIYLAVYMLFHVFIAALLWLKGQMRRRCSVALAGQWETPRLWPCRLFMCTIIVVSTRSSRSSLPERAALNSVSSAADFSRSCSMLFSKVRSAFVRSPSVRSLSSWSWRCFRLAHNTPWVASIGFLDRLASISLSDDTIHARLLNIGIASKGVAERPILGWGQENYAIVFDKYYDPRMYAQEPWFDRVHNIIFDWLVAGGIVGLAAYLSIFAATLWELWNKTKAGVHIFTAAERSIITGLLAGYFIHNLSVFDNVTSYILFGTVLAYLMWRGIRRRMSEPIVKQEILPATYVAVHRGRHRCHRLYRRMAHQLERVPGKHHTSLRARSSESLDFSNKRSRTAPMARRRHASSSAQIAAEAAAAPSANVSDAVKQQFFRGCGHPDATARKSLALGCAIPAFHRDRRGFFRRLYRRGGGARDTRMNYLRTNSRSSSRSG